jgi:hypothetical protein
LEGHHVDGSLNRVHVRGQYITERANGRLQQRPSESPSDLIKEAEE